MMKTVFLNSKYRLFTLQLLGWGVILATSLYGSFSSKSTVFDSFGLTLLSINIVTLLFIYLLNYLIFIPIFLFGNRKYLFFIANAFLLSVILIISYYTNEMGWFDHLIPEGVPRKPRGNFMFLVRDFINYVLMIGLVMAFRLSEQLQKSEEALKEAENARVKAELDNLRSQINPHFLLNTLNNIYALTAIDTDKAQKTIKELSNLLRYILYDNLNERVPLLGEVDFLKTYIELMSIRLPRKVDVSTEFVISPYSTTTIAPLIFISLVENAFKHSVSSNGEGFIVIRFEDRTDSHEVILSIMNSNHAKCIEDKSGHGIGLEQVKKRLELIYPHNHTWEVVESEKMYESILTLKV